MTCPKHTENSPIPAQNLRSMHIAIWNLIVVILQRIDGREQTPVPAKPYRVIRQFPEPSPTSGDEDGVVFEP